MDPLGAQQRMRNAGAGEWRMQDDGTVVQIPAGSEGHVLNVTPVEPAFLQIVQSRDAWLMRVSKDGGVEFNPEIPNAESAAARAFVDAVRQMWDRR